jgi:hypothetical protein
MNTTTVTGITPTTGNTERLAALTTKIAHHTRLIADARHALQTDAGLDHMYETSCLMARIERSQRLIAAARAEYDEWEHAH